MLFAIEINQHAPRLGTSVTFCLQHVSLFTTRGGLAILSNNSRAFLTEDFCQRTSLKGSLCCALWHSLRLVLGNFGAKMGSGKDRAHIRAGEAGPFIVEDADLAVALKTM